MNDGMAYFGCVLQRIQPLVYQVITDVRGAIPGAMTNRAFTRQVNGALRDIVFVMRTFFGEFFNHMAVTVARGKIHRCITAVRILP